MSWRMNDDLQRSQWLARLATVTFCVLTLVIIVEAAMVAVAPRPAVALAFLIAFRAPAPFYLFALWTMRLAFGRIANGEVFSTVLPNSLTRLGLALALGAIATVFVSPLALRLIGGYRHGAYAAFDPSAITIGLVGLFLTILSHLFSRALIMKHELDEIL
jgi:hypothetical protein